LNVKLGFRLRDNIYSTSNEVFSLPAGMFENYRRVRETHLKIKVKEIKAYMLKEFITEYNQRMPIEI
jgi:hypothetical protein